jgi:lipopolysaccharide transport system ATP-binding protein
MSVAVHAFDVGKRYQLGQHATGYDLVTERIAARLRRPRSRSAGRREDFWALRGVSFELQQGETLGVIGHNGAGKSTLLKILSRVTAPTTGGVDLHGRVGALLEVGTGFHAELTGAENVYLNGALLGMRRHEVARHFDEIVAFAEVEDFIHTPVKRYSSGMYMRLAFAVSAHLEPEILIVDEVLSVGDFAFQEKCLRRMQTVARDGRTVLFVSHNVSAVAALCQRSIMLERGTLVADGPTDDVIEQYIRAVRSGASMRIDQREDRHGSGRLRFVEVEYLVDDQVTDTVRTGDDVDVLLRYETDGRPVPEASFAVAVHTLLGRLMLNLDTTLLGMEFRDLPASGELRCRIPRLPLPAGAFTLTLYAYRGGEVLDLIERAAPLTVVGDVDEGRPSLPESVQGVLVDYAWEAPTLRA